MSLGHYNNINKPTNPLNIKNTEVVDISAGGNTSVIVSNTGKIFTCGESLVGKLGIQTSFNKINKYKKVDFFDNIKVAKVE